MIWIYTITSVIIVSLVSLIGLVFLSLKEDFLRKIILLLVSFSAGALLGDVFIHLLPETVAENGFTLTAGLNVLTGIIVFFILEEFVFWHHCHKDTNGKCHSFAYMNLVGDGVHNFIDGIIIGASYLADFQLGLVTTIAVLLHEIPQEIGDFGVLLHGGYTKKKALLMNFLSASLAVIGAILILVIGSAFENIISVLLPFTAGGFIYISSADLIPELHRNKTGLRGSFAQLFCFIGGIIVMLLLLLVE